VNNRARVEELMRLAGAMDTDTLLTHFAPGAVMELPFAPGSMPKRYDGIDAIRGFMEFARDSFSSFSMTVDAIHETADPNVLIAEHRSDGVVAANGRRYENRYCTVLTFDGAGQVVHWREYYDAGVVVRAFRP